LSVEATASSGVKAKAIIALNDHRRIQAGTVIGLSFARTVLENS
jgi:hypothetical protein